LLVVDDEPEVLRSVHDLLRLDYRVLTCTRGADALKVLDDPGPIHVVLSDQRMPGMTGVDVLRHAKEVRPEATRLLFTAYADIRAVVDAINQGSVFHYIAKPWEPDELQAVVRQAVEQHDLIVEKARLLEELKESNQRLAEANRLKSAFIEVASHELNTPVAVVLGMSELWKAALSADATEAQRGWVERVHLAAKRLAGTIERMFKLIRADEFGKTLDLRPTELAPLVREVISELQPFLEARDQRVALELDPDLGTAEVDPSKLADILTNLFVNAIKFTPDGGTIRVSAQPVWKGRGVADGDGFRDGDGVRGGDERVRFRVADEGVGIQPSDRPHLFQPFFTGFDTMHHSSGDFQFCKRGIGLGLCLVKTFVELHGGAVEFDSAPGRGTTFEFTIPRHARASRVAVIVEP
jgi:signal transduction histidine kinase